MNARPHDATATHTVDAAYDVARVRAEFPVFGTTVRGKRLAFLDTAASAQQPRQGRCSRSPPGARGRFRRSSRPAWCGIP